MYYTEPTDIWLPIESSSIYEELDAILVTDISYKTKGVFHISYLLITKSMEKVLKHTEKLEIHLGIKNKYSGNVAGMENWVNNQIAEISNYLTTDVMGNETEYIPNDKMYITLPKNVDVMDFVNSIKNKYYAESDEYTEAKFNPKEVKTKKTINKEEDLSDVDILIEDSAKTNSVKSDLKVENVKMYLLSETLLDLGFLLNKKDLDNIILITTTDVNYDLDSVTNYDSKGLIDFDTHLPITCTYKAYTSDLKVISHEHTVNVLLPQKTYKTKEEGKEVQDILVRTLDKIFNEKTLYNESKQVVDYNYPEAKFLFHVKSIAELKLILNRCLKSEEVKSKLDVQSIIKNKIEATLKSIAERVNHLENRQVDSGIDFNKYGYKKTLLTSPFTVFSVDTKDATIYMSYYFGYAVNKNKEKILKLYDYTSTVDSKTTNISTIVANFLKFGSFKSEGDKKEFAYVLMSILNRKQKLVKLK